MIDYDRFSRQIVVPEIGAAGQEKIEKSTVLITGDPSIGESAKTYLDAAGFRSVVFKTDSTIPANRAVFQVNDKLINISVRSGEVVIGADARTHVVVPTQGELIAGGLLGAVEVMKSVVGVESRGEWIVNV